MTTTTRKITKILTGTALAALAAPAVIAATIASAPAAQATAFQDSRYVACVATDGLYSNLGPSQAAAGGRQIAIDISAGLRSVTGEQEWVYRNTPSAIARSDANVMVNCATEVYLGFGPDGSWIAYST
jgi:hypothetical protein